MIEVCGNMITDLIQQDEQNETIKGQIDGFFDLLEERVLDVNPYCRSKLFQVYWKLLRYLVSDVLLSKVCHSNSRSADNAYVNCAFVVWKIKVVMSGGM